MSRARRRLWGAAALWLFSSAAIAQSSAVGVREIKLHDESRERPVWLQVWYPASSEAAGADVAEGRHPIALLSHGALGSARSYAWLGEGLAKRGWVVLGVSHFGESWIYGPETVDPANVLALWQRPLDLKFVLDAAPEVEFLRAAGDFERVAILGHSSGGNTAIAIAGGILDPQALGAYCAGEHSASDRGCDYARGQASATPSSTTVLATASYRDERVAVVVALDPAVGPGYDRDSLAQVTVPVIVFGSVDNDFLPFAHHAQRYAQNLPNATLHALDNGEGHFVYLDPCSMTLEANGVPLCTDRPGVDRSVVHEQILENLAGLERHLERP